MASLRIYIITRCVQNVGQSNFQVFADKRDILGVVNERARMLQHHEARPDVWYKAEVWKDGRLQAVRNPPPWDEVTPFEASGSAHPLPGPPPASSRIPPRGLYELGSRRRVRMR